MKELTLSVVDSLADLETLKQPWNQLLANSVSDSVFLTWEWQYSWADTFVNDGDKQLFVIAVYSRDRLVGIAPWYVRIARASGFKVRQLRFLGSPNPSDHLDLIVEKGWEAAVTAALYSFLFSNGSTHWDSLRFEYLASESLFLMHLQELVADSGRYSTLGYSCTCPAVILPSSSEEFLQNLSPNRRQQYRRHLRILEKQKDIQFQSCQAPSPGALDSWFANYEKATGYSSKRIKPFIEKLIEHSDRPGFVQIDTLADGGRQIASLFHLRHGQTVSMLIMAIDKTYDTRISIGNIIVGKCIENAIADGFQMYDFLRGSEPYKFHWANRSRALLSMSLYQRRIASVVDYSRHAIVDLKEIVKR